MESELFPGVDCLVLNEGEVTIPIFLEGLKSGNLEKKYTLQQRPDITQTPAPDWSLINQKTLPF
jgi:hypothetical protein